MRFEVTASFWILLAAMAGVTYLIRMLPLVLMRKKIENQYIKSFLCYIPYSVLGAMTIPDIFSSVNNIYAAITGFMVACFLAYKRKGLLTVAMAAVLTVFVMERILNRIF